MQAMGEYQFSGCLQNANALFLDASKLLNGVFVNYGRMTGNSFHNPVSEGLPTIRAEATPNCGASTNAKLLTITPNQPSP
jgi:hypothetical protein